MSELTDSNAPSDDLAVEPNDAADFYVDGSPLID
jgi:hypothetical protein